MKTRGKRYLAARGKVEPRLYTLDEAVKVLKGLKAAKFDESVDVSMNLGVDPKHADQMVRGTVVLPHGTGKSVRVAAFATGEKARGLEHFYGWRYRSSIVRVMRKELLAFHPSNLRNVIMATKLGLKQTTTTLPSFGRPPFSSECPRLFRYRERIGRRRRVRWLRDSSLPRNR